MKLSSPPRGNLEGKRRVELDPSSRSHTDCTPLRDSSATSSFDSSSNFPAHAPTSLSSPNPSSNRSVDSPRGRKTRKRERTEPHRSGKKRKSSKTSKKRKHHKKKRRVSRTSSTSSPSPGARSRSTSRSSSQTYPSEIRRPTPLSNTGAYPRVPRAIKVELANNRTATGWDVGPGGRKLPVDARHQGGNGAFPSSTDRLHGHCGGAEGAREEEDIQRHNPKTYEKAFGVSIPSGQYSFVSEDTDLTLLLPAAPDKAAVHPIRTTAEASGPVQSFLESKISTAATGRNDSSIGFAGLPPAVPPALGVYRLLKEAHEGEKARQARDSDNSAGGLKRRPAQGGSGGNKITSKTHPHLFWQCWNCSADNYKTRHQCFRCNRLYMQ